MREIINKVSDAFNDALDWFTENMALIAALVIPIGMLIGLAWACVDFKNSSDRCYKEIAASGYKEADARAFINVTDFSCNDLRESDGALAQFKRFLNGEEMTIKKTVKKSSTVIVPIYHR